MRYFIRWKIGILFTTDVPGKAWSSISSSIRRTEFADGTLRKDRSRSFNPGTCRIRFHDPLP